MQAEVDVAAIEVAVQEFEEIPPETLRAVATALVLAGGRLEWLGHILSGLADDLVAGRDDRRLVRLQLSVFARRVVDACGAAKDGVVRGWQANGGPAASCREKN